MNQEEREANNILNALQNAVADVSAQAGGRKRRSRKPKSKNPCVVVPPLRPKLVAADAVRPRNPKNPNLNHVNHLVVVP